MHGGASTGPKTAEGLERCRKAPWKHGRRSAAAIAKAKVERRKRDAANRQFKAELKILERLVRRGG